MRDALLYLAGLYGIAAHYNDIWGKRHEAADDALVALLDAMGVQADTPDAIRQSISQYEVERWHHLMAPVLVVRTHKRPWLIRLNLLPSLDNATLSWRIEEESGAQHEAELRPFDLPSPERWESDGELRIGREWQLDIDLPLGYHHLFLRHAGRDVATCLLIVAPERCFQPPALQHGHRIWGTAVQLYSLRSASNWGIGDFADLGTVIEQWGARGGGIVGVNPLHALFPHNAEHCSPYSPSSRLFKNVLYLAVENIEDLGECKAAQARIDNAAFQSRLQQLRDADQVSYVGVSEAKFKILELLYASFRATHLAKNTPRAAAFRKFQQEGGIQLRRHALFEALQAHFHARDAAVWGWPSWPEAYRKSASVAVEEFAEQYAERVEFYEYMQWQADLQLRAVRVRATEYGLSIGLYEDLAVSIDRGGAESWGNQDLYAIHASVGAPPDEINLKGQNWGLPPLIPERLRAAHYAPFIRTLRANMRHSGALRIDHVMGLARLFWVPPGMEGAQGAYVAYPFDDLLGILALESERQRCLVIGEDLGTVPDEVRHALYEHRVLSYRLLYFERHNDGGFKAPHEYPVEALVTPTTHDLPTLSGWWEGHDIEMRAALNLFPDRAMRESQWTSRRADRGKLLVALAHAGCLPEGVSTDPDATPAMTPTLAEAITGFLATSPAKIEVVQIEDVFGLREQANMPGTLDEHPNWRRKLTIDLADIPADARFIGMTRRLAAERGAK